MLCLGMALPISFMFEKWTKKLAGKATDGAVEGVKETLNDKIDQYGDIIKFGLVMTVIAIGGHQFTKRTRNSFLSAPEPYHLPAGTQPVIINNYYPGPYGYYGQQGTTGTTRDWRRRHEQQQRHNCYVPAQTAGKNHTKR